MTIMTKPHTRQQNTSYVYTFVIIVMVNVGFLKSVFFTAWERYIYILTKE